MGEAIYYYLSSKYEIMSENVALRSNPTWWHQEAKKGVPRLSFIEYPEVTAKALFKNEWF